MTTVAPAVRPLGRAIAWLALLVYVTTAGGSLTSTDAVVTYDVSRNIVDHGSVAMSGNLLGMAWHEGRGGQFYAPFGIGQSIWNVPFYAAAKLFVGVTGVRIGRPDTLHKAAVAMSQTIVCAAIVWVTFLFGVAATGGPRAASLGAVTLAFASVLWPYSGFGFNQPLAALTFTIALYDAVVGTLDYAPGRIARAGWWLAASVLTRHEMALGVIPIFGWILARSEAGRRLRNVLVFLPGLAVGAATWMTLNWWRFGNPLDSGYLRDANPGLGSPVTSGLVGLFLSPSTSLLLYSPFVVVGLLGLLAMTRTRDRAIAWLLLAEIVVFVVLYATLGNWTGGRSYGSRYLLVVLPLFAIGWSWLLAGLGQPRQRVAFVVVFVVGFMLQLPGVLVDYAKVSQQSGQTYTTEDRQWSFDAAPLVANARDLAYALPNNIAYVTGRRTPPRTMTTASEADRGFSQQFAFSLDFWWLYLYYLGALNRLWMLAIVSSLAAGIAVAAHAVRVRGLEFDA
ncbi:MAG TPA: hypothetical protein VFO19_02655 [Vicinamibacterales bacterium]|nr:hypothetical protein [Vicinamibacterales bacterium]